MAVISPAEFRALAEFRFQVRSFLKFSERAAKAAGIEPQQHQLLLIVKAAQPECVVLRGIAERLQIAHHSAVGLVDRLEAAGMVRRERSDADRRSAQVQLTEQGERVLAKLSLEHRRELKSAAPALIDSLRLILREEK